VYLWTNDPLIKRAMDTRGGASLRQGSLNHARAAIEHGL
jgi:hypothetical protein